MTAAERRWCWIWAAVVMALTTVPYLWCWWQTPPGREFCWVLYGRDDHAVYMAWLRQVADGSFFLRNLFTTDLQGGRLSNVFFFLLGQPVRFLGIEPALVLQVARVGFGALLLVLVYRFAAYFTESLTVRRTAFWLSALAGGLGWGQMLGWYDGIYRLPGHLAVRKLPTDLWQPEGFTFLSVYSTALFAASTCAIVGILCLLLQAERTGRRKWALGAGVLALLLGNFHSYDIIHVTVAWGLYLLLKSAAALAQREEIPWRSWGDAVVCALIGLPTTLLQYYFYRTDPVFQQRANYETLSPDFSAYVLGYGLVLLLALPGAVLMLRGETGSKLKPAQRWMPLAWAVAGFIVAYLPFAFNRKMIMGTHVPLCLLAAVAAVALVARLFPTLENAKAGYPLGEGENAKVRRKAQHGAGEPRFGRRADSGGGRTPGETRRNETGKASRASSHFPFAFSLFRAFAFSNVGKAFLLALIVLLTAPTNVLFVLRDVADRGERPEDLNWFSAYWPQADLKAAAWIRQNTPREAAFFCTPLSGRYIAAAAGRAVYAAHWGETPRFAERVGATVQFFQQPLSAEERMIQLKTCATNYVYQGTTERRAGQVDLSRDPGLEKVYDADGVTIYRVKG